MLSNQAESELIRRLELAGVPAPHGVTLGGGLFTEEHPAAAWKIFKEFGALRMDDLHGEDDGLLFQGGIYDFAMLGGRKLHFSFVRQFVYYEDGDYDHMEQLECCFLFEPTPDLEVVQAQNLWSFGFSLDDFYTRVEQMPAFRVPIDRRLRPSGLWLEQFQV